MSAIKSIVILIGVLAISACIICHGSMATAADFEEHGQRNTLQSVSAQGHHCDHDILKTEPPVFTAMHQEKITNLPINLIAITATGKNAKWSFKDKSGTILHVTDFPVRSCNFKL